MYLAGCCGYFRFNSIAHKDLSSIFNLCKVADLVLSFSSQLVTPYTGSTSDSNGIIFMIQYVHLPTKHFQQGGHNIYILCSFLPKKALIIKFSSFFPNIGSRYFSVGEPTP